MGSRSPSFPLDDLRSFGLSRERGFLPSEDPLRELPSGFGALEEVAGDLPRLLLTGHTRRILECLPALPIAALRSQAEVRRAMLLLSFVGHAYVWCEDPPVARIPASIAVPWCAIAARLGRPPVLSYASYALDNWLRIDPTGPIELGNIMLLQNFLGGADEDWFIGIHIDIEFKAARALRELGPALRAVSKEDVVALVDSLHGIAAGIESMTGVLKRTPEHCDPYIYYRRVRPYIHGWKAQPALPSGVVYEGVEAFGESPQLFRGETGAQSGVVPALDAVLVVPHAADPLRTYLMEMRDYMPPDHRAFLTALEATSPVGGFVECCQAAELREAYNHCLHWLETFRSVHLDYASSYIHRQRPSSRGNPTDVGTGGTPFMSYLKKHRDETARQRIE